MVFAALADPSRRRIFEALCESEQSVGALVDLVGLSQPGVSQHLKVLREAGLARVRADGQRRLYSVDPAPLSELEGWLERCRHLWQQRLDALDTHLKENQE